MHLEQVLCRACRVPYSLEEGCELCQKARDNMIKPDPDDALKDSPIAPILSSLMRILQIQASRLESDAYAMAKKKRVSKEEKASHLSASLALIRTAPSLIAEARKAAQEFATDIEAMSLSDKSALVVSLLEDLPKSAQLEVANGLSRMLGGTPLLAEVVDAEN